MRIFFLTFRLDVAVKAFVLAFAVGLEPIHDGTLPKAVFALAKGAFSARPSFCHAYSFLRYKAFCVYLKTVIGELSEEAPIVKELMRKGMLLPE